MPNGTTHAKATFALAVAGGATAYHLGHPMPHVIALSAGALAGLILTPDLDVDDGCISNRIVRRTTNRPIAWMWARFWRPYGLLIPHRSRLSHMPLLGTALRLAYLSILPALLFWFALVFNVDALARAISSPVFPPWSMWAIGGLVLADTLHYLMDQLF